MLTIEQIKERLQDRSLTVVAERTGIDYQYLYSIKMGYRDNPTYKVYKTLSDYLTTNK